MSYLITTDHDLLAKLAAVVDAGEGYVPKRASDYVTERHADIDAHPDGKIHAYPDDAVVRKYTDGVAVELSKYGVDKTTILAKWTDIQDGKTTDDSVLLSGAKAGIILNWATKDMTWISKGS